MMSASLRWIKDAIAAGEINLIPNAELTDAGTAKRGGHGSIQPAHWIEYGKVAVKSPFDVGAGSIAYANFKQEVEILLKVRDERYIVPFLGLTEDSESRLYMMVFAFADGGNLEEYLRETGNSLEWPARIRLAIEITESLAHIHAHGILHKDFHSGNILIHRGRALIADFGCSRSIEYDGTRTDFVGRYGFGPPEKLRNRKNYVYDSKCDIYSLGAVFWNISSGRAPFSNTPECDVIGKVCRGEREAPVPETPPLYMQLYMTCWENDPFKRPEIRNILSSLKEISQSLLPRLPLSPYYALWIESWISKSNVAPLRLYHTWKLLYRGSRDGFLASDFHRCCDGRGPTVTIIQPYGVNRLIGGYNSKGWTLWNHGSIAQDSFIFSIGNGVNDTFVSHLKEKNDRWAIRNYIEWGPLFGLGDLYICNGCDQNSRSYCSSWTYDRRLMDDMEKDGDVHFGVKDYEVYGINKINNWL